MNTSSILNLSNYFGQYSVIIMSMITKITKRPIKATTINLTHNYSLFFVNHLYKFLNSLTFILGYFAVYICKCSNTGCLQIPHPCLNCHLLKAVVKALDCSVFVSLVEAAE